MKKRRSERDFDSQRLCEEWNRGSDKSRLIDEICRRYSSTLYRSLIGKGLSHDEIQDIMQESFLTLYRVKELRNIRGLLYKVVHSKYANLIRSKSRRRARTADYAERVSTDFIDPEANIHDQELIDATLDALERLGARERRLVELRYLEGLPATDVAEELGISRRTFYNHHDAAIEKLRATFREQGIAPALVVICLEHFKTIPVPSNLAQTVMDAVRHAQVNSEGDPKITRNRRPWPKRAVALALAVVPAIVVGLFVLNLMISALPKTVGRADPTVALPSPSQGTQPVTASPGPLAVDEQQTPNETSQGVAVDVLTAILVDKDTNVPIQDAEVYLAKYSKSDTEHLNVAGQPMFQLSPDASDYFSGDMKPFIVPKLLNPVGPFMSDKAGVAEIPFKRDSKNDDAVFWDVHDYKSKQYEGTVELDSLAGLPRSQTINMPMQQLRMSPARLQIKTGLDVLPNKILVAIASRSASRTSLGANIFPELYLRTFDSDARMNIMFDGNYGFAFMGSVSTWLTLREAAGNVEAAKPMDNMLFAFLPGDAGDAKAYTRVLRESPASSQ
jgi:RNA polymerase sigma-70 factor (ECF subfamily)